MRQALDGRSEDTRFNRGAKRIKPNQDTLGVAHMIENLRKDKGLSLRELARAVGWTSMGTSQRLQNEPDRVGVLTMLRVFKLLGMNLSLNGVPVQDPEVRICLGYYVKIMQRAGLKIEVTYGS